MLASAMLCGADRLCRRHESRAIDGAAPHKEILGGRYKWELGSILAHKLTRVSEASICIFLSPELPHREQGIGEGRDAPYISENEAHHLAVVSAHSKREVADVGAAMRLMVHPRDTS